MKRVLTVATTNFLRTLWSCDFDFTESTNLVISIALETTSMRPCTVCVPPIRNSRRNGVYMENVNMEHELHGARFFKL
jgi:hypothetical protein